MKNKLLPVEWLLPAWLLVTVAVFVAALLTGGSFGWGYLCLFVLICIGLRPRSLLHTFSSEQMNLYKRLFALLIAALTIAACILPMDDLPLWNGEIPEHRNQYELMAENLLEGRLDFAYGDEGALKALKNPYDPAERKATGVRYHWDHAYYDGHYYMYFGIVPVLLLFLPYRAVTGMALTTCHATQIFTAAAILGIFLLFHLLTRLFFKKLPFSVYLALSVAFSVMSVWYAAAEPALYCTAITAAIALEVWSLYFFVRAVWGEQRENRKILFAGIGALLGALVFGCRPTIALANILVIPMLAVFLSQRKCTWKLAGKLALAVLPYAAVAAGLMLYNYARFGNPFEFGQKYQLTVADQSQYSVALNAETRLRIWNETMENFFAIGQMKETFPYLDVYSVFYNFPVLLLGIACLKSGVLKRMYQAKLLPLMAGLLVTVLVITAMDIVWTPYLLERYRMDIYFLMGIGCFLTVGVWHSCCTEKQQAYLNFALCALSVLTVISAFLLCVDTVGVYYPEEVMNMAQMLRLK